MARKTSPKFQDELLRNDFYSWRLLVRNPDFRKNLKAYLNALGSAGFYIRSLRLTKLGRNRVINRLQRLKQQYLVKWGIERLPDAELWPDSEPILTPHTLELWYQRQREEEPKFTIGGTPVYMTRDRIAAKPGYRLIEFQVDVRLPIDGILSLLDKELRSWYWAEFGSRGRGKPQSIDFHLKVFDLVSGTDKGRRRTFVEVARMVKSRPSTVRDAYSSIVQKIGLAAEPLKATFSDRTPDELGPISECPDLKCRNAETTDDLCEAHSRYIDRDQVPQNDLISNDLSSIEHGQAKSSQRRKHH